MTIKLSHDIIKLSHDIIEILLKVVLNTDHTMTSSEHFISHFKQMFVTIQSYLPFTILYLIVTMYIHDPGHGIKYDLSSK